MVLEICPRGGGITTCPGEGWGGGEVLADIT